MIRVVPLIFRSGVPIAVPKDYATDPHHRLLVSRLTCASRYADVVAILEANPDSLLAAGRPDRRTVGAEIPEYDRRLCEWPRTQARRGLRALMRVLNGTKPRPGRHRGPTLPPNGTGALLARWRADVESHLDAGSALAGVRGDPARAGPLPLVPVPSPRLGDAGAAERATEARSCPDLGVMGKRRACTPVAGRVACFRLDLRLTGPEIPAPVSDHTYPSNNSASHDGHASSRRHVVFLLALGGFGCRSMRLMGLRVTPQCADGLPPVILTHELFRPIRFVGIRVCRIAGKNPSSPSRNSKESR